MRRLTFILVAVAVISCVISGRALAIPAFQKVFFQEYIVDHEDAEYTETVKKEVKCFICHQGKKKKHHNAFGEHLEDRLDKKEDKKNTEKIVAMLMEVVDLPFNPEDPDSETYGERIAAGKLPAAETLEELKVEPEGSEEDSDEE